MPASRRSSSETLLGMAIILGLVTNACGPRVGPNVPKYTYCFPSFVPLRFLSVVTGDAHSCGLDQGQNLYCWGDDQFGQVGLSPAALPVCPAAGANHPCEPKPTAIVVPVTLKALSAGSAHTCGLSIDNNVYCWGHNNLGQLGNASRTDSAAPVRVVFPSPFFGATAIASGRNHTCALVMQSANAAVKRMFCWGDNASFQLGTTVTSYCGSATCDAVPVEQTTADGQRFFWGSVTAGGNHTCGNVGGVNGNLECFGSNQSGELGNGQTSPTPVATPQTVVSQTSVRHFTQPSAGSDHTCALNGSSVMCWGFNFSGQLGNGNTSTQSSPVSVSGASQFTAVAAGVFNTCGIAAPSGSSQAVALCWGDNGSGQLGNGSTGSGVSSPTTVGVSPATFLFTQISVGKQHACAIAQGSQTLFCWGDNSFGQAGFDPATYANLNSPQALWVPTMICRTI